MSDNKFHLHSRVYVPKSDFSVLKIETRKPPKVPGYIRTHNLCMSFKKTLQMNLNVK